MFIIFREEGPDIEQEILFSYSLYYQNDTKIPSGLLKKKNERFCDTDLSFFFFFLK